MLIFQSRRKHTTPCTEAHTITKKRTSSVRSESVRYMWWYAFYSTILSFSSCLYFFFPLRTLLITCICRSFSFIQTIKIACIFSLYFGIRICFPARAGTLFGTISTWAFCGVQSHVCLYFRFCVFFIFGGTKLRKKWYFLCFFHIEMEK